MNNEIKTTHNMFMGLLGEVSNMHDFEQLLDRHSKEFLDIYCPTQDKEIIDLCEEWESERMKVWKSLDTDRFGNFNYAEETLGNSDNDKKKKK